MRWSTHKTTMDVHIHPTKQTPEEHLSDCQRMKDLKRKIEAKYDKSVLHVDDATTCATLWTIPISFNGSIHVVDEDLFTSIRAMGASFTVVESSSDEHFHAYYIELPKSRFYLRLWSPWEKKVCICCVCFFLGSLLSIVHHVQPLWKQFQM
jgi:hypothetical protein